MSHPFDYSNKRAVLLHDLKLMAIGAYGVHELRMDATRLQELTLRGRRWTDEERVGGGV